MAHHRPTSDCSPIRITKDTHGDLIELEQVAAETSGYGHPVKNGFFTNDLVIYPSHLSRIPTDATHVIWFDATRDVL